MSKGNRSIKCKISNNMQIVMSIVNEIYWTSFILFAGMHVLTVTHKIANAKIYGKLIQK